MENNELTYIDDDEQTVFTSNYLKKRGTCCKTNCLHCPYGHTLKNLAIEVHPMSAKHIKFANEIIRDTKPVEQSELSSMLLSTAFGPKDKIRIFQVTETNFSNYAFAILKDTTCGVIEYSTKLSESASGKSIKNLYLRKHFQNQGLGIEHISLEDVKKNGAADKD